MRFYLRDWHRKERRRQHLPEGEHCWNPRAKLRNNAGNNRATAEKEAAVAVGRVNGRGSPDEAKELGAPVRATGAAPKGEKEVKALPPKEEREVKLLPDSIQITEMRWSIREGKLVHIVRYEPYKTFAYRPLFPSKNPLRDLVFSYVNSLRSRVYVRPGEVAYIPWKEWISKRRGSSRAQYVCKPA